MTVQEYNKKYGEVPLKRPANVSLEQWEKAVNLYNVAKSKGDRYPELTVAQAALETGWFKSPSGKFNYFGQKATQSQKGTEFNTKEVANNQVYKTRARFRDYENLDEAVDDRVRKWSSKYAEAENVDQAIDSIWKYNPETGQGTGYATDSKYDSKLKSILGMMGVNSTPSGHTEQDNINTEVSNLQNPQTNTTFVGSLPPLPQIPTKEEEKIEKKAEKEEDSKEKTALKQKQKEYEFMQELATKMGQSERQPRDEYPQEQLRLQNLLDQYNQVSQLVENPYLQEGGQIPVSSQGMYEYPSQEVIVPTDGQITMKGIDYQIIGQSLETGERQVMQPDGEYFFKNTQNVLETPLNKKTK